MRLRTSVLAIIAIILASVGGWAISRTQDDARAPLTQALEMMPADTRVAGFTDWAQIRGSLGFEGRITSAIDRKSLIAKAFERNLSARSILEGSTEIMDAHYGWTIADLRWEMYGQASDGSVMVAGFDGALKGSAIASGLREIGYEEVNGVWSIDAASVKNARLPAPFANVAVLDDERLIVMSDQTDYLDKVVAMRRDHDLSLAGVAAARQTAAPLVGAHSAVLQAGKDACTSTGFADQPAEVVEQARNAVRPFGKLETVLYGARAIFDREGEQQLRFSMTFGSAAEATRQAELRAALTTGPLVGRTGRTEDVLTLTSSHTDGPNATLDFDVDSTKGSFMGGSGPLLFAACSPG